MLACQPEFDGPRHPLTSFYPTREPGLSPLPLLYTIDKDAMAAGPNFRKVDRTPLGRTSIYVAPLEIALFGVTLLNMNFKKREFTF